MKSEVSDPNTFYWRYTGVNSYPLQSKIEEIGSRIAFVSKEGTLVSLSWLPVSVSLRSQSHFLCPVVPTSCSSFLPSQSYSPIIGSLFSLLHSLWPTFPIPLALSLHPRLFIQSVQSVSPGLPSKALSPSLFAQPVPVLPLHPGSSSDISFHSLNLSLSPVQSTGSQSQSLCLSSPSFPSLLPSGMAHAPSALTSGGILLHTAWAQWKPLLEAYLCLATDFCLPWKVA